MQTRISQLQWDDAIIVKLWEEHHVEWWEVEEVVLDDEEAKFRWHTSRKHGSRLLVRGKSAGGRRLFVVLAPVDPENGVWRCRTAWEERR